MLKKLGLGLLALVTTAAIAIAAGAFNGYPIVGDTTGTTTCLSFGNGGVCNQYSPAGPASIPSGALIPADTGSANQPFTVNIPFTSLTGAGNLTINSTTGTGQAIVVAAGVSSYLYTGAGIATFATFTFPASPTQNQSLCLYNAGTGILTLTSLVATGKTLVGTTPTSIPVAVANGAQATVTNAGICYIYDNPTLSWYRIQ